MLESTRRKFWKQQRQLPAFPPAGKSCKLISRNYTQKTTLWLDFQVAHIVKKSVAWEPPRYATCLPLCSNSQRVHQPSGAHGQGSSMWYHGLVTTERSGDHLLHCQEFCCLLWWPQEITRFVQSIPVNSQIVWHHLIPSALSPMWYRREWDEFKPAEIHCNWHQGLIVDYIDVPVCETW